tara:strand:- start:215 stop:565 length:351 start_codon:yes stop_codon:yes gene_type:complete
MIPAICFFIALFLFVNFFDYAKTFYDVIPGDIVGDVNFSTYPGAVYIFFIYLLFQYFRTKNLKYIDITIMFLSCFVFARTFSIIFNGISYSLFIPIALIPEYIGLPVLIYIRKKIL